MSTIRKTDMGAGRAEFHALAGKRYARFLETGESIPWEDARIWLRQRLAGKRVKRPVAGKQAR